MNAFPDDIDDVLHPDFLADPYLVYDYLRANDPVHWNERLQSWMLLRYEDVKNAVFDYQRFSSARTAAFLEHLTEHTDEPFPHFARIRRKILLYTDPPVHTRLRRPIRAGLPRAMVAAMRPKVEQVVADLLDDIRDRDQIDVMDDLALRLPAVINTELIGIPPADREKLRRWSHQFIAALNASGAAADAAVMRDGEDAAVAMLDYFAGLARERHVSPAGDLVTTLVTRAEGEPDFEGIGATCIVLLFAGLETVSNIVGNGTLALLRNPRQLALVVSRPELVPHAIEELLRYDTSLQMVGRMATTDVTVGGRHIRRGDRILPIFGAANHDPEHFRDPRRLDVTRNPNPHLSFSFGRHYCPGAELVRIETEVAFTALLPLLANAELDETRVDWQKNATFRAPTRLRVRLKRASTGALSSSTTRG